MSGVDTVAGMVWSWLLELPPVRREVKVAVDLVMDATDDAQARQRERHHAELVRVERRVGELPPVRARPGELQQVLVNLLTNAVQAMPSGGDLVIEAVAREGAIEIAVEDTGPGVDPAHRDTIFEPFFTTRGSDGGTGLGLAVAREIVLRHGGAIRLADGRVGARFVVSLPIGRAPR